MPHEERGNDMIRISDTIELPHAEYLGKETGGRWVFTCAVCDRWAWRRDRWTLAGAYICEGCTVAHNATVDALGLEYTTGCERAAREARYDAVNAMYGHADVSCPDDIESPGAVWLLGLHHAVTEAWDDGRIASDARHPEDVMSEMADTAIPIYTHNRWQIFIDLCAYHADVDAELLGDDMTDSAGTILREVAYRAFSNWREEKIESSKCEECDEFPCECPEYGECQECGVDAMECYWDWARANGLAPSAGYQITGPCTEF